MTSPASNNGPCLSLPPAYLPSHPQLPPPRFPNPQIDSVIAACRHRSCVRALFSATLPEAVEGLARSVLKDPLRITVGERNTGGGGGTGWVVGWGREVGGCLSRRLFRGANQTLAS